MTHRCPSSHEIGAALRVAGVLPLSGVPTADARASYDLITSGGLHSRQDFQAAEALLRRCGLIEEAGSRLTPCRSLPGLVRLPRSVALEVMLVSTVERDPPNWLWSLDQETWSSAADLIPEDDLWTFEAIVPDPYRRQSIVLGLAREAVPRVPATSVPAIAMVAAAFRAVLEQAGRAELAKSVVELAPLTRGLGCNILAPMPQGGVRRILVKSGRSRGSRIRFTLSREEADAGSVDTLWTLVVCVEHPGSTSAIAGWCEAPSIAELLPADANAHSQWTGVTLDIDPIWLAPLHTALAMEA